MIALPPRFRLRSEDGQTLVELLIAMLVLSVGILALVAAYSSGYVSLNRATRISSATVLADSQMERFRALKFADIQLDTSVSCGAACTEDATYTSDAAYDATAQVTGCATSTEVSCLPTQTKTGPDGRSYRMDTFVKYSCVSGTLSTSPSVTCGSGQPPPVKLVTVVVRSTGSSTGLGTTAAVSVREQSNFTSLTGS